MKKLIKTTLLFVSFFLVGCNMGGSTSSQSEGLISQESEQEPFISIYSEDVLSSESNINSEDNPNGSKLNYSREYKTQLLIGETLSSLTKAENEMYYRRPSTTKKENELSIITIDENSTLEITRVEENPYARPEIKSLNEPLSKAFGMIEYFTQYDISDISILDTTFYSNYRRSIYGENGWTNEVEDCTNQVLVVRDFPSLEEKMFFIRYSWYNCLIHIDENEKITMLTEYVGPEDHIYNEENITIGYSDIRRTSFQIQADDYVVGAIVKTSDYASSMEGYRKEFVKLFEEKNLPRCSFLLNTYYDMYKLEDGTYDVSDIMDKNHGIDVNDKKYVHIDSLSMGKETYTYWDRLQDAFFEMNYDLIANPRPIEHDFCVEGNTLKYAYARNSLMIIPESITSIEYIYNPDSQFEGKLPEYKLGDAVVLHKNIEHINKNAFDSRIISRISHIFVDMPKEECPYVDVLDGSGAIVLYEGEFMKICDVYVPIEPHLIKEPPSEDEEFSSISSEEIISNEIIEEISLIENISNEEIESNVVIEEGSSEESIITEEINRLSKSIRRPSTIK